jgi:hypothetical protein
MATIRTEEHAPAERAGGRRRVFQTCFLASAVVVELAWIAVIVELVLHAF